MGVGGGREVLLWLIYLHLSDVCVSAILMVGKDVYLEEKCSGWPNQAKSHVREEFI